MQPSYPFVLYVAIFTGKLFFLTLFWVSLYVMGEAELEAV